MPVLSVLERLFDYPSFTQLSLCHLKEYRTAIISAAVTGKIDVRGEIASQDEISISSTVKY